MDSKLPKLNKVAEEYQMEVRSSRSIRRRIANTQIPFPRYAYDDLELHAHFNIVDVPCYDITIPQDKFEELVETLEFFDNQSHKHVHAMQVLQQARADEQVRQDNPAVQNAWMRYLMLLELARK